MNNQSTAKVSLAGPITMLSIGAVLAIVALYLLIFGIELSAYYYTEDTGIACIIVGLLASGAAIPLCIAGGIKLSKNIRHNTQVNRVIKSQQLQQAQQDYAQRYVQQPQAQQPYVQQPYTQQPYTQQPYAQQPYAQQTYAQQPYAQQPYAQQPYAQQPYAQQPYAQQPYAQQAYAQPRADATVVIAENTPDNGTVSLKDN